MGYAISWVAVRGKSADEVCRRLGVSRTGDFENVPDSPIVGAELQGGWYLVWGNDMGFTHNLPLGDASQGAEAVECFVEEHVMASGARGWKNGQQIWSVEHFPDKGTTHLDAKGELPPEFTEIRDRLLKEQAQGSDVFSVPVELAKVLTGFAYDQNISGTTDDDDPFEVLKAVEDSPLANGKSGRGGCLGVVLLLSLLVIGGPVFVVVFAFTVSAFFRWLFSPG